MSIQPVVVRNMALLAGLSAVVAALVMSTTGTRAAPATTNPGLSRDAAIGDLRLEVKEQGINRDRQLRELEAEVSELRQALSRTSPPETQSVDAPPPLSSEEREQRSRAKVDAMGKALSERLAGESEDRAWSSEQEEAFRSAFSNGSVPGNGLAKIDCGTSLCRLLVRQESPDAAEALAAALGSEKFPGGNLSRPGPGEGEMTVYVFREGQFASLRKTMHDGVRCSQDPECAAR